ncbi:MAG: hypothetical protein CEE40_06995, partial [Chloroflexi bacterium B3_Chlor]
NIKGFDTDDYDHRKEFRRIFAFCTASKWSARAFLLIDIVDFSTFSTPEQLALRMSLGQAVTSCARRFYRLQQKGLVQHSRFNRVSTGDGFYIWSYDTSPDGHVSTFLLLIFLMTLIEFMRKEASSRLALRAACAIDEAYTFPYDGPGTPPSDRTYASFRPDAIGPVLNKLSRLVTAAVPGQILIAPFEQPGREERPDEILDVPTMVDRIKSEILPGELDPADSIKAHDIVLELDPPGLLRATDKHGLLHHCYNLRGAIPNRAGSSGPLSLQSIGLVPDDAARIETTAFRPFVL